MVVIMRKIKRKVKMIKRKIRRMVMMCMIVGQIKIRRVKKRLQ
jgi:hypothetical protein